MGGGKSPRGAGDLAHIANAFFVQSDPARKQLLGQFEELLTTGGMGARVPIVRKAVEGSKRATSKSLQALKGDLARTGLAGTPFGENIRSTTRREGEFATSQIEPQMAMQIMNMIPNFLLGLGNTAITGLSGAAQANAAGMQAGPAWLSAMLSPFKFGFGG